MKQLGFHYTDFDEMWYLSSFSKICRHKSSFNKIWQEQRALCMKTFHIYENIFPNSSYNHKISKIRVVEKIKIRILCSVTFCFFPSRKSCRFWVNVEKSVGDREAADSMAHERCMLDKKGYTRASTRSRPCTHTHTHEHACMHPRAHKNTQICNICCFSTATMVSWTRLDITLHVHCLYC